MSNMIKSTKKSNRAKSSYILSLCICNINTVGSPLATEQHPQTFWVAVGSCQKNKKKTQLLVKFPQKDKIHKPIYTYVLSVPAAWRGPHLLRCSVSRQVADWQSSSSTQRVCPLWEATYSTERPTGSQASTYAPDSINTVTHSQWPDSTWQQKESGKVMYLYNS